METLYLLIPISVVLVFLIARGPGAVSVDHLIAARFKPIA